MTTEPYLTIDWPGATEAAKTKALAIIAAAFEAAGITPVDAAFAAHRREGEALDYMSDERSGATPLNEKEHAAADLWDGLAAIVAPAMGFDGGTAQDLDIRLEPLASEGLRQIHVALGLAPTEVPF